MLLGNVEITSTTPHATRTELSTLERDVGALLGRIETFQDTLDGYSVFLVSGERAADLRRLPDLLRTLRQQILNRLEGPKLSGKEGRNAAWAHLVAYVLMATGRPHDSEVAQVLTRSSEEPSADAIKMFRSDHRASIEAARRLLQDMAPAPKT